MVEPLPIFFAVFVLQDLKKRFSVYLRELREAKALSRSIGRKPGKKLIFTKSFPLAQNLNYFFAIELVKLNLPLVDEIQIGIILVVLAVYVVAWSEILYLYLLGQIIEAVLRKL